MKICFLVLLLSGGAFAQSTKTSATNTSSTELSTLSWGKIKEKFRISYFSETLGPSIKKWDDNEIEDDGRKKREPMTMYHSFNVRYSLTQKFNLFMSPRVSTVIGDRNDIRKNADPHVIVMDDWQFGIFYTFLRTPTFQYNNRFTHRAPFSTKSRNENIDSQIEWQHDFTWMPRPEWRIILWNNYRYYAFNEDATEERYRINFTTLINYQINDRFNAQVMHEWDMQHRNTNDSSSPKHRDPLFLKRYKNYFSYGMGYSPVPSLTIIPFIRVLDERNIRNETTMVGLWILGRVI